MVMSCFHLCFRWCTLLTFRTHLSAYIHITQLKRLIFVCYYHFFFRAVGHRNHIFYSDFQIQFVSLKYGRRLDINPIRDHTTWLRMLISGSHTVCWTLFWALPWKPTKTASLILPNLFLDSSTNGCCPLGLNAIASISEFCLNLICQNSFPNMTFSVVVGTCVAYKKASNTLACLSSAVALTIVFFTETKFNNGPGRVNVAFQMLELNDALWLCGDEFKRTRFLSGIYDILQDYSSELERRRLLLLWHNEHLEAFLCLISQSSNGT